MKLYFQEQGEGPALIIIHGLFGSSDNWRSMAKYFARTHRVITIDLRNHGRSPHNDSQRFDEMADDLLQLMDLLNITSASLLGHSLGGKVAMQFAASYPNRVEQLIVVDITTKRYFSPHTPLMDAMMSLDLTQYDSRQAVDNALADSIKDPNVRLFLLMNLKTNDQGFYWRINLAGLKDNYGNMMAAVCEHDSFTMPTLFIYGADSDYVTLEDIDQLSKQFYQAQFVEIAEAGHWVHAEKPQRFKRVVEEFLTDAHT
jgi:pimeloyl-ACP methyl ester carboxylesterase